jgi:serine/threonine protein kinase
MYCPHCGAQNDEAFKFCKTCGADLSATLPLDAVVNPKPPEPEEPSEIDLVRRELEDEYEILQELGRGGMAIVFHAREKQLDRDVAIKVLPFSLAFDKEFVERFQREARTAARLEHPGIIPIYRVGKSGRVIFFVMKYLRGKSLSTMLVARGALPPLEIRHILVQVARALAYAHRSGTVHRDIKPDNIMFDEHGQALVTDFGIAKAATGGKLTGTGMAIGTPHYMSPEQARAQALDGRSDIYSLGVVAYQCLTGMVPFDGEDSFSIGYKHIMEELPVPEQLSDEQRDLFEIVRQMLGKTQDERFQTADDLADALESGAGYVATGLSSAQTRAIPSLAFPRLATAPTTPLPRATLSGLGTPPGALHVPRRERSVAAGLLIWLFAVAAILGGGGFYAYKQGLILHSAPVDTSAVAAHADSLAQAADSVGAVTDSGPAPAGGTAVAPAPAPGTPGRLVLAGVPDSAQVTMDGQAVRGRQLDLAPGSHKLTVQAPGYVRYEGMVLVAPGGHDTTRVRLKKVRVEAPAGETGGGAEAAKPSCTQFGTDYNLNGSCFDSRPTPLGSLIIQLPPDAVDIPRPTILLVHVSADGETLDARVFSKSNMESFDAQALDLAKSMKWSPARKDGNAVESFAQVQVVPRKP